MLVGAPEPMHFLSSPRHFATFCQRAGFAAKNPFLRKEYSETERSILDTISKLPPSTNDFSANVQHLSASFQSEHLEGLIRKVMHLTEEHRSRATTRTSLSLSVETVRSEGTPSESPREPHSSSSEEPSADDLFSQLVIVDDLEPQTVTTRSRRPWAKPNKPPHPHQFSRTIRCSNQKESRQFTLKKGPVSSKPSLPSTC